MCGEIVELLLACCRLHLFVVNHAILSVVWLYKGIVNVKGISPPLKWEVNRRLLYVLFWFICSNRADGTSVAAEIGQ